MFLGKCRVFVLLTPPALLTSDMANYEKTHKFSGLKLNPSLRKLKILTIDGSGFSGLSWERSKSFQWKDDAKKKSWKKKQQHFGSKNVTSHVYYSISCTSIWQEEEKEKMCPKSHLIL